MTLEPGIHEMDEAPWWLFHCESYDPVTEQWMRPAALVFARQISGEEDCDVKLLYMSGDGMSGHFIITDGGNVVMKDESGVDFNFIVTRGEMVQR